MNILLRILAALLYGASGGMKVFLFDKISEQVPSFGALPREAWMDSRHPRTRLHIRADRPRRASTGSRRLRWWPKLFRPSYFDGAIHW